ncbi:MAG: hypothetical protein LIP06_06635 [Tannerellaceae bacterium]|nr:hypothetical protein [Tannerellaceae bacterium]
MTEENVFLYIRGHKLYALCCRIGKKVCDHLLTQERERLAADREKIAALFKDVKKFQDRLIHNIWFESYPEIIKIKEDMEVYAGIGQ